MEGYGKSGRATQKGLSTQEKGCVTFSARGVALPFKSLVQALCPHDRQNSELE